MISGASRGIGRAIAERALEDGHRVSIGIRDFETIKDTKLDPKNNKSNILINKYDANNPSSANIWIKKTIKEFGGFDSLINCAGIFHRTKFIYKEGEEKEIDQLFKINVMAPWYLTKECWKMITSNKNGRIIFLVSLSGKRSKGSLAGYSMSKFALMGLCQTIRNEGWDLGTRVTTICPGWVNTQMTKDVENFNKDEMTQTKDIASICSNLLTLPNSCVPFEISVNCLLDK